MLWQLSVLGIASVAASAVVLRHRRMLTFLATAGVLWEAQVLFLTWIERLVFPQLSAETVFTVGAIIALVGWGIAGRKALLAQRVFPAGRPDAVVLGVIVIVLAAAWLIASRNQYGLEWVTHGFFNGDVATFTALTQRAMETGRLVNENPFAGNGPLEYPSLLHASVANVLSAFNSGHDWMYFLSFLTFAQIVVTVPMFFAVWDAVFPEPGEAWQRWFGMSSRWLVLLAQAGIVLYVMGLSWENYVYPQSHFFLTGLFLLLVALLVSATRGDPKQHLAPLGAAAAITLVLLFSNAVVGTAAVALKIIYDGLQARRPGIAMTARLGWLAGVVFWVVIFFVFTPGNGSISFVPGFSYTAAFEFGRLALPVLLLLAGVFAIYERDDFVSVSVVALLALGVITFLFSNRGIIIENSSRFLYHALLIGFPLLLSPAIRLGYWLRRELVLSSRSLEQLLVGWGGMVAIIFLALVPVGASVASTHDNLMFKDERRVSTGMREALWWIEEHTAPGAVFLTAPEAPFAIPIFTGRAMLRSDTWLSPDDSVLADVKAAFEGSAAAQEAVLSQADYLLLTKDQRETWESRSAGLGPRSAREPLPLKKVFDINSVVIYQLR